MTVLRPSLPPVSSTTTRMVSLPGAAACAVLGHELRDHRTQGPPATTLEGAGQKLTTMNMADLQVKPA